MSWDPITFRRLGPEDASILSRVAPETFDHPVRAAYLRPFLASENHEMIVALAGDLVVGMVSGVVYYHPDKPAQMWINEVGTAEDWRQRGIGHALTEAMIALAWHRQCDSVWLGTEADNVPALATYRKAQGREVPGLVMFDWGEEED